MAEFDGRTSGPLVEANQAVEFCYISDPMRSSADRNTAAQQSHAQ
jgi:hypothetical protein